MKGLVAIFDCYFCSMFSLRSFEIFYNAFLEIAKAAEYTPWGEPIIFATPSNKSPLEWGLSGNLFIFESNIAMHSWPERQYLNVIVNGCKEFSVEQVQKTIQGIFAPQEIEFFVVPTMRKFKDSETMVKCHNEI